MSQNLVSLTLTDEHVATVEAALAQIEGVFTHLISLSEEDRRLLRNALAQAVKSGRVWRLFNDFYPPNSLAGSVRPLH